MTDDTHFHTSRLVNSDGDPHCHLVNEDARKEGYDPTPKKSRHKRDSNPGSFAIEADALTTRPTRRYLRYRTWCQPS